MWWSEWSSLTRSSWSFPQMVLRVVPVHEVHDRERIIHRCVATDSVYIDTVSDTSVFGSDPLHFETGPFERSPDSDADSFSTGSGLGNPETSSWVSRLTRPSTSHDCMEHCWSYSIPLLCSQHLWHCSQHPSLGSLLLLHHPLPGWCHWWTLGYHLCSSIHLEILLPLSPTSQSSQCISLLFLDLVWHYGFIHSMWVNREGWDN